MMTSKSPVFTRIDFDQFKNYVVCFNVALLMIWSCCSKIRIGKRGQLGDGPAQKSELEKEDNSETVLKQVEKC